MDASQSRKLLWGVKFIQFLYCVDKAARSLLPLRLAGPRVSGATGAYGTLWRTGGTRDAGALRGPGGCV